MIRTSSGVENIFDAQALLQEAETDISVILFILGIEQSRIDSITIDEIVDKIKESYDYRSSESNLNEYMSVASGNNIGITPAPTKFLRVECNALTRRIRRAWFNKEFALDVIGQ